MNLKHPLLVGLLLVAAASLSKAQVLNFDVYNYGTASGYTGLGAAADSSSDTYWNDIKGSTVTSNLLSDGTTSSDVTLAITHYQDGNNGYYEGFGITPALLVPYEYTLGSAVQTITLSNVASGSYSLYLYGINGSYASNATSFTIDGAVQDTINAGGTSTFVLGNNYVEFTGITPTSGDITITYQADAAAGSSEGDFNGLQLVTESTPEPSSYMMLLFGISSLFTLTWLRSRWQQV